MSSVVESPLASHGDGCKKCGARATPDQRYCVECGEPRGESQLARVINAVGPLGPQPAAAPTQQPLYFPPAPPQSSRAASGMALLSTVAVLLLAMGVGVLIGNAGGEKASNQQPMVIGGAGLAPTGATGDAAAEDTAAATSADADGETSAGVDANALAKKNGVKLAEPDVDLGDKCEEGSVGCSDEGTFDGEYFE